MNTSQRSATIEPPSPGSTSKEIVSQSDIEQLLAQIDSVDPSAHCLDPQGPINTAGMGATIRRHDFPKLSPFSSSELRPLRVRHEDFIGALATRLSIHLGFEVGLQMSKLEAVPYQKFADGLSNPTYLALTKMQPLEGICLLDIPPRLGLCIVDRELGGPGRAVEESRQIGKIEVRLLAPFVSLIASEWCSVWGDLMEIRPSVIGSETNSRYIRTSSPETTALVIGMEMRLAGTVEQMQLAFPQPMLEPLTLKLNAGANSEAKPHADTKTKPGNWNALFDDIQVKARAEVPEVQIPVGQLAELKVGDILHLPPQWMSRVHLRLANHPGFVGTLGAIGQQRAIQIAEPLER